jgi:tetratricopeptide (TPR) repeat protein
MAHVPQLTPLDIQLLQQAFATLQAGDAVAAEAKVRTVLGARKGHPDTLHLLALTLSPQGRTNEARDALEAALKLAPHHPQILNSYGNLLDDAGETELALRSFEKALKADPNYTDAWINFGIAATSAGKLETASKALMQATILSPNSARAWNALGFTEQQQGNSEAAIAHLRRGLKLNPLDRRAQHNLAVALRSADEAALALEQFNQLLQHGFSNSNTKCMRAHALADLGCFEEAMAQYQEVIDAAPEYVEAHDALAALLPQLGRGAHCLDSFKVALAAAPRVAPLWQAAILNAQKHKHYEQMLIWAEDAKRTIGPRPEFEMAQASALTMLGQNEAAKSALYAVLHKGPETSVAHNTLTHLLLMMGDIPAAQTHALRASILSPIDQSAWAYLTVIWRLMEDPREHWLADYDQLVRVIDIEAPADYHSDQGFWADIDMTLTGMHQMQAHPAEQSLRGGTQSRGTLFDKKPPVLRALAQAIKAQVTEVLAALPNDPSHPFLSRKASTIGFSGSWSVRLANEGFHINHIHPEGWLSSACYISLPPEIGSSDAGALTFGVPDASLGLTLSARRIEIPKAGRLVIFPSYLWHGTLPFVSDTPRLTVAFDALPA